MKIRAAILSDLDIIIEIFRSSINAISTEFYSKAEKIEWLKTAENKKRWTEALKKQRFFIAELDDVPAGFISLENNEYIDFIYVHPQFSRMGIAKQLLNHIEQIAKESNTKCLKSHVSKIAIQFFKKNGFKLIQENKHQRGSEVLINYTVEKSLD